MHFPTSQDGGLGCDGSEDDTEHAGPGRQVRGINDGRDGGLALSRPHCPVTVGDLALNDGGSQGALAGIVRDLDQ